MRIKYRDDLIFDQSMVLLDGEPGPPGADGVDGVSVTGERGSDGVDGASLNPRGEYQRGQVYHRGDVVREDSAAYACIADSTKSAPSPESKSWMLLVQDGERGERGESIAGPRGRRGEVSAAVDVPAIADSPMVVGAVIYVSGPGHVDLAEASPAVDDGALRARAFGMVTAANGSAVKYRTNGVVENPNWSLTPMAVYYLSPTVPGGLTLTYPNESGQFVVIVGVATSQTQIALNIHWMLQQS